MQLTFDADVEAFRAEFMAFLDEPVPPEAEALERSGSSSHVPGLGASLAAADVRQRVAAAGEPARIRAGTPPSCSSTSTN